MSEDGLISFDFMGGDKTVVEHVIAQTSNSQPQTYDMLGCQLSSPRAAGFFIQRRVDGSIRKYYKKMQ